MQEFSKLAEYGGTGIAIALIIAILVGGRYIAKLVTDMVKEIAKDYNKNISSLSKNIKANTKVTTENLEYLKHRNGSLEENNKVMCASLEKITTKLEKIDNEVKGGQK